MKGDNKSRIAPNVWTTFIIFGLIGQIAWTIENMYLNVFIYKTVTYNPDAIAIMVAASAVVATVATLAMGALSDKLGKRKIFMTVGYIIWGLSIMTFGFITKEGVGKIFPNVNVIAMTVAIIVIMDCVMTFIGSTSNDAAFNAWVTDVTVPSNRGKAEGVLATMPLISMLIVFGLLDSFTQNGKWKEFFIIIGITVVVSGIAGLFLIKDKFVKKENSHYFKDLLYGFKPSTIKENKLLYIILTAVCVLGIAQQVFLPYFIIYFEFYLGITDYAILLGAVLLFASIASVIMGRLVDKFGKQKFLLIATLLYIIGMFILFVLGKTIKDNRMLTIMLTAVFGTMMMGSYLLGMIILNSATRDLIPKQHVGLFSGIRMIFFVLVPMVIGPFIGSTIIKNSSMTYTDEFGVIQSTPIPEIFLGGAIVGILSLIPIFIILRSLKKSAEEEKNEEIAQKELS